MNDLLFIRLFSLIIIIVFILFMYRIKYSKKGSTTEFKGFIDDLSNNADPYRLKGVLMLPVVFIYAIIEFSNKFSIYLTFLDSVLFAISIMLIIIMTVLLIKYN